MCDAYVCVCTCTCQRNLTWRLLLLADCWVSVCGWRYWGGGVFCLCSKRAHIRVYMCMYLCCVCACVCMHVCAAGKVGIAIASTMHTHTIQLRHTLRSSDMCYPDWTRAHNAAETRTMQLRHTPRSSGMHHLAWTQAHNAAKIQTTQLRHTPRSSNMHHPVKTYTMQPIHSPCS